MSSYGKSKGKNLQNQARLKLTLLLKPVDKWKTLPKTIQDNGRA